MEHALREKAKSFWAMRRSYEAIAKHNQVSGRPGHPVPSGVGKGQPALAVAVDTASAFLSPDSTAVPLDADGGCAAMAYLSTWAWPRQQPWD